MFDPGELAEYIPYGGDGVLEVREIECILTLGEHLHFGRAARELRISQARVSQTLRSVEHRIGGKLFDRTSRQVSLTPLGKVLLDRLRPLYVRLTEVYSETLAEARGIAGTIRLGFTGAAGGRYVTDLIRATCAHLPACDILPREVPCGDLFGALRGGEVEMMVARLPVEETDLTVGPVIGRERRVLAVALDHPLAGNDSVSIEDVAQETVVSLAGAAPAYWRDHRLPQITPAGRRFRHGAQLQTCQEVLSLVAAGRGVAPLTESAARHYARPDTRFVRIRDLPPLSVAVIWRTADENARIRAIAEAAEELGRQHTED